MIRVIFHKIWLYETFSFCLFKFRLNQYGMLEVISDEEAQVILNSVRGNAPPQSQPQAVRQVAISQTPQPTRAPNNHQQTAASNQVYTIRVIKNRFFALSNLLYILLKGI